jgi:phosphoglycolate phosphatase-like HAD superfamily hydrolase
VLYGFGTREELTQAGAGHIVETVLELKKMLLEEA